MALAASCLVLDGRFKSIININVLGLLKRVREEEERRWVPWSTMEEWAKLFEVDSRDLLLWTRFLVERGRLVTLKHEASDLAPDLVVLDPAWLASVFSTVVA